MVDAEFDSLAQHCDRLIAIAWSPAGEDRAAGQAHGAEAKPIYRQVSQSPRAGRTGGDLHLPHQAQRLLAVRSASVRI